MFFSQDFQHRFWRVLFPRLMQRKSVRFMDMANRKSVLQVIGHWMIPGGLESRKEWKFTWWLNAAYLFIGIPELSWEWIPQNLSAINWGPCAGRGRLNSPAITELHLYGGRILPYSFRDCARMVVKTVTQENVTAEEFRRWQSAHSI